MIIKYIDNKTKKEIVTVHSGFVPTIGHVFTIDTLPSNPKQYVAVNIKHMVYLPPNVKLGEVVPTSVDELKIFVSPISKRFF